MLNPAISQLKQPKPNLGCCSFRIETHFGFPLIAGVDEVGRGCLAGPVTVAAVVFPTEFRNHRRHKYLNQITDSKRLLPEKREELSAWIRENALAYSVDATSELVIDEINILQATFKSARNVLSEVEKKLAQKIDLVLMDGPHAIPGVRTNQHPMIEGDQISKSIAAASILAKVERDRMMVELDGKYPGYGFDANKGYGTHFHYRALIKNGPCAIHRKTFLKKIEGLLLGINSEELVCDYLCNQAYRILERNWTTRGSEIDVIAEKNGELHFFEIRARSQQLSMEFYFTQSKQTRFQRAVEKFMVEKPDCRTRTFRLHLMLVYKDEITPCWDVFKL